MKKILLMMMVSLFVLGGVSAQTGIEPIYVSVAYNKTTNLVFPYNIKSVDRGSLDLLVQKAKNVENVLQVKAGIKDFEATNLTVITADGHLYSFLAGYSETPDLNMVLESPPLTERTGAQFTVAEDHESKLLDGAEKVARKQPYMNKKDRKFDITLKLGGIYAADNLMYFQLELRNGSHIPYDIGQLRFYIRDRKTAKRTASQERELQPLFILGNVVRINGHSVQTLVIVLDKFTIPDKKYLAVQMMEAGGGRHLELKEGNRTLMKSRPIR